MGWRQRFDPARLRIEGLREHAARLRDIRTLGEQVSRVRRAGLRGEVLVPIVALLILAVTLGLSTLAPAPGDLATIDGTPAPRSAPAATRATPANETRTTTVGYPAVDDETTTSTAVASPSLEPSAVLTPTESIIAGVEPTVAGYPGPTGPEGVGPPPGGGVPPTGGDSSNSFPPAANPPAVPQVPPPPLIPTPPARAPSGNGYPPPVSAQPQNPVSPPRAQPSAPRPGAPQTGTGPTQPAPDAGVPDGASTPATQPPTEDGTAPTPVGEPTMVATPTAAVPTATPVPPTPTARPAEVLSGNVRWSTANSPVVLSKDILVAPGAFLTIDPGVEVQFAPDVRLSVGGTLRAGGNPALPVRMVGPGGRWDGLVGAAGSTIVLDGVELRQAGRNGTALSTTGGSLVMHRSQLTDSGGGIVAQGSVVELRSNQITGNSVSGPAVNVLLPRQSGTAIVGNIIGANGNTAGAPQLLVTGEATPGSFVIENNQIIGAAGPGAVVNTTEPLAGTIRCNSFVAGTVGLQLTTKRPNLNGFNLVIDSNAFTGQSRFGATGSLPFNVAHNWWGDPSGPSDAQRNPQGRGVPVGVTLQFHPWLSEHPACAPR